MIGASRSRPLRPSSSTINAHPTTFPPSLRTSRTAASAVPPVAYRLGVGLTIARKPGKLPFHFFDQTYDLEYGSASLQIHQDGVVNGARVLIADDLLATGGTADAAVALVRKLGGNVVGCAFIVELDGLKGRERLAPINCFSLIHYD